MIYIDCIKKSLFTELCESKNKELVNTLIYCFKLATIVKTKANSVFTKKTGRSFSGFQIIE